MADKVSIFIDGGYLFRAFKQHYKDAEIKYSPQRLVKRLFEGSIPSGVYYFDSINNQNRDIREKQERFFNGILRDKFGWNIEILPLQFPGGIAQQKGVDTAIALKLFSLAIDNSYDTAILLAADSDFVPAVDGVKKIGKVVSNAFFVRCPSWHLQQACNGKKIVLDEVDFIYKKDNPKDLFTLKEHFQKK